MINKIIPDSSFYNITKSSNNANNNSNNIAKSSNVANKYMDTVQQFSNITKGSNNVANTYNNPLKDSNSIAKGSNSVSSSFNSANSATQNVDPDEYNIPESTTFIDSAGVFHLSTEPLEPEGLIYSGGHLAGPIFQLRYAEHSTDENPIISARGRDENGKEFTQLIDVNKIDPSNATPVEIIALQASLTDGQYFEEPEDIFLMGGILAYHPLGEKLNDRNNYTLSLEMQIELYPPPTNLTNPIAVRLSKILEDFKEFTDKNNIPYPDNSSEIASIHKQRAMENISDELNYLSSSIDKEETNLDDELLKLLDKNKEDKNDK